MAKVMARFVLPVSESVAQDQAQSAAVCNSVAGQTPGALSGILSAAVSVSVTAPASCGGVSGSAKVAPPSGADGPVTSPSSAPAPAPSGGGSSVNVVAIAVGCSVGCVAVAIMVVGYQRVVAHKRARQAVYEDAAAAGQPGPGGEEGAAKKLNASDPASTDGGGSGGSSGANTWATPFAGFAAPGSAVIATDQAARDAEAKRQNQAYKAMALQMAMFSSEPSVPEKGKRGRKQRTSSGTSSLTSWSSLFSGSMFAKSSTGSAPSPHNPISHGGSGIGSNSAAAPHNYAGDARRPATATAAAAVAAPIRTQTVTTDGPELQKREPTAPGEMGAAPGAVAMVPLQASVPSPGQAVQAAPSEHQQPLRHQQRSVPGGLDLSGVPARGIKSVVLDLSGPPMMGGGRNRGSSENSGQSSHLHSTASRALTSSHDTSAQWGAAGGLGGVAGTAAASLLAAGVPPVARSSSDDSVGATNSSACRDDPAVAAAAATAEAAACQWQQQQLPFPLPADEFDVQALLDAPSPDISDLLEDMQAQQQSSGNALGGVAASGMGLPSVDSGRRRTAHLHSGSGSRPLAPQPFHQAALEALSSDSPEEAAAAAARSAAATYYHHDISPKTDGSSALSVGDIRAIAAAASVSRTHAQMQPHSSDSPPVALAGAMPWGSSLQGASSTTSSSGWMQQAGGMLAQQGSWQQPHGYQQPDPAMSPATHVWHSSRPPDPRSAATPSQYEHLFEPGLQAQQTSSGGVPMDALAAEMYNKWAEEGDDELLWQE
jgi:hypothetical protein